MSVRGRSIALLAAGCVTLLGARALAFVRTMTRDTAMPLYWVTPKATLEVTRPPEWFPISPDAVHAAAEAAAAAWSYPTLACTTVALDIAVGFADSDVVAPDGHNRIIMRTGAWCRDPVALTDCHEPSQVALTTVYSRSRPGAIDDGQIFEADVEINDVGYEWAALPDGEFSARDYANAYDLRSALTHEMGHFLGLAHDCVFPGDPIRFDDSGNVSPDCSELPAEEAKALLASTMYPVMKPADTEWRSLSSDDTRAACSLYGRETLPIEGWCSVGASRDEAPSLGLLLGTAALFAAALIARSRSASKVRGARCLDLLQPRQHRETTHELKVARTSADGKSSRCRNES